MNENPAAITRLIRLIEDTNKMILKYNTDSLMSRQYLHQKMKLTKELEGILKNIGIEAKLKVDA